MALDPVGDELSGLTAELSRTAEEIQRGARFRQAEAGQPAGDGARGDLDTALAPMRPLAEWGAIRSTFDSSRRCHLHSPVGNALSIVATVFRRREQVVFQQFRQTAERSLTFIKEHHGERDPRVLTLQSILTTCNIAEAMMQLVLSAVQNAMTDSESVLSRAVHAALKVGVGKPARWLFGDSLEKAVAQSGSPEFQAPAIAFPRQAQKESAGG